MGVSFSIPTDIPGIRSPFKLVDINDIADTLATVNSEVAMNTPHSQLDPRDDPTMDQLTIACLQAQLAAARAVVVRVMTENRKLERERDNAIDALLGRCDAGRRAAA
jgi:hypothetical protein